MYGFVRRAHLVARREAGYALWRSPKGVAPLLDFLRRSGLAPFPEARVASTPAELLLERYRSYLSEERGLSVSTVNTNVKVARQFLGTRTEIDNLGLSEMTAREVIVFVVQCQGGSSRSMRTIVTGLRSFLRFTYLAGMTRRPLADVVPTVASWRLAALPRPLRPGDGARLLRSCDRRTPFGRRDFAVLLLLYRLGLRAGEVAYLRLEDIDWRAGELLILGKGPKLARLPLPTDVGAAIASWLRHGRPRCVSREVFTRIRAPHRGLSPCGVSAIVSSACRRAEIPEVNAHRLRHAVATELLAKGAGLVEVGQLLRHESLLTTAIYAKVDRVALLSLAKPWPTSESGR